MAKQISGNPILIEDIEDISQVSVLNRVKFSSSVNNIYDENWIQNLIFKYPDLIPVDEIEPIFSPLIPICRELQTGVGPVDNIYVNSEGFLTIVECKLWRNPDARRDVVGQILDYAKEISALTYEELSESVRSKTKLKGNALYKIALEADSELDEVIFVDKVTRNLKKGNFLLLIVGDGIKESVENIANFLQKHAGIHFTFGLVELGVYKFESSQKKYLVQPRVLTRTIEIERAVVRTEGNLIIQAPENQVVTHKQAGIKKKLTEDIFYEKLKKVDPEIALLLPVFFSRCRDLGLIINLKKTMILHWYTNEGNKVNFGSIFPDSATIRTNYICDSTKALGDIGIGVKYLEGVSKLIEGSIIRKEGDPWTWKVIREGRDPEIKELLVNQDSWIAQIELVMNKIRELET